MERDVGGIRSQPAERTLEVRSDTEPAAVLALFSRLPKDPDEKRTHNSHPDSAHAFQEYRSRPGLPPVGHERKPPGSAALIVDKVRPSDTTKIQCVPTQIGCLTCFDAVETYRFTTAAEEPTCSTTLAGVPSMCGLR
jgi:hypothetical protein